MYLCTACLLINGILGSKDVLSLLSWAATIGREMEDIVTQCRCGSTHIHPLTSQAPMDMLMHDPVFPHSSRHRGRSTPLPSIGGITDIQSTGAIPFPHTNAIQTYVWGTK